MGKQARGKGKKARGKGQKGKKTPKEEKGKK